MSEMTAPLSMQRDFDQWDKNWHTFYSDFILFCQKLNLNPNKIRILPVTKGVPAHAWQWVLQNPHFKGVGESRLQEILDKKSLFTAAPPIEMIGHLQSNKVGKLLPLCDRIQSVDSQRLAERLQKACEAQERETLRILIEVNIAQESNKTGLLEADLQPTLDFILASCPSLRIEGFMTMGQKNVASQNVFQKLFDIKASMESHYNLPFPELSMGMSGDWREALEAGSTLIRIGHALFKDSH